MTIWIGTSGYSYPEWRGSFYPDKMPPAKMFAYYVERLSTVEINNTFYKMPDDKLIDGWAAAAPERFRFTLKAPQRITHILKLKNAEQVLSFFLERAQRLGDRLGALLFQLHPSNKRDDGVLRDFVALLPKGTRAAFEFRNKSWLCDEVYEILAARDVALCIADSEKLSTPIVPTASYGYYRLRDEGYEDADIARWADSIRENEARWKETFVYFKHEDAGKGPAFAKALSALLFK